MRAGSVIALVIVGLLIGILVGAIVALLLAFVPGDQSGIPFLAGAIAAGIYWLTNLNL